MQAVGLKGGGVRHTNACISSPRSENLPLRGERQIVGSGPLLTRGSSTTPNRDFGRLIVRGGGEMRLELGRLKCSWSSDVRKAGSITGTGSRNAFGDGMAVCGSWIPMVVVVLCFAATFLQAGRNLQTGRNLAVQGEIFKILFCCLRLTTRPSSCAV